MKLEDFREQVGDNDRIIQMALRETDSSLLAEAMAFLEPELRDIIYRNMSVRASKMLTDEVTEAERTVSQHSSRDALEFFVQKLSKYRRYTSGREHKAVPETPPPIDVSSDKAVVETFAQLSWFVRIRGWLALEGADEKIDDPLVRKGLEMAIDGWDPMIVRQVLERMAETALAALKRRQQMVIEGIDSLLSADVAMATEEKLRAFIQEE